MLTAKLHFFTLDGQICLSPLGVLSRFPLTWIHQASIIFTAQLFHATNFLFFTGRADANEQLFHLSYSSFSISGRT